MNERFSTLHNRHEKTTDMRFLDNLKLSQMIMIVALVPIMAMIFFSAQTIVNEIERRI